MACLTDKETKALKLYLKATYAGMVEPDELIRTYYEGEKSAKEIKEITKTAHKAMKKIKYEWP